MEPQERLRAALAWISEDDVAGQETGRTLLWYAALRGDVPAIEEILANEA